MSGVRTTCRQPGIRGGKVIRSEALNGVQLGCFSGRIVSKENSDAEGKQAGDGEHLRGQPGGEFEELFDGGGGKQPREHSQYTSQQAEGNRFAQKLQLDVPLGCSHRQTDSNLARPLGDRYQHDIHNSDAPDQQGQ